MLIRALHIELKLNLKDLCISRNKLRNKIVASNENLVETCKDEFNFEMCGLKQWVKYPNNPDKIIIEADMNIFKSDYYLLKLTSNDYSCFTIRVLFGTYDIENPLEGLNAKRGEIKEKVKGTRPMQKRKILSDNLRIFVDNTNIRNKLFKEIDGYKICQKSNKKRDKVLKNINKYNTIESLEEEDIMSVE